MAIGRIRKKSEYQQVARKGERVFSPSKEFIMQGILTEPRDSAPLGNIYFGYIVTRKNGPAVVRNKIRRRLKEACLLAIRQQQLKFHAPAYVVLVGFKRSANVPFPYLVESIAGALQKMQQRLVSEK